MIDPEQWVALALERLEATFGPRLLYVGLQGSYRRGEATESSDIDLVVLLDALSMDDLDLYRGIVRSLPEGEKACGFISSAKELLHWPRHELFPFKMDTRDHRGRLDDFLPPLGQEDARESARIGASALYHLLTHSYLYAAPEERPDILRGAYKSAFFVMLVVAYLKTGVYAASKRELLEALAADERAVLTPGVDVSAMSPEEQRRAFGLLREWCARVLASVA